MAKEYILAHDLGTTGNKACLFDLDGNLISRIYRPYSTYYPCTGCVEQRPEEWWQAVSTCSRKIVKDSGISSKAIACVTFSGHMMGCVPVDKKGNLVRKGTFLWADTRSVKQAEFILDKIGRERFYKITGAGLDFALYPVTKIMWIKENEPDVFQNTYKFLGTKDYIILQLTDKYVTDYSDASNTGLLDLYQKDWSKDILSISGIPLEKLPELHNSTDVVGEITRKAAEETGLSPGTPVVMGGGDVPCASVGAGAVEKGSSYTYIGSASWISKTVEKPLLDLKIRFMTLCHLVPNLFVTQLIMYGGGICYQWFKESFFQAEEEAARKLDLDLYNILELRAKSIRLGAEGLLFLPYMRGGGAPHYNLNARGAFIGLNLTHKKENFIRSILEGIAFNLNVMFRALEEKSGEIRKVQIIGGGGRSKLWCQIIANICNKIVIRPLLAQEANALGAAIAGGVGVGVFRDFSVVKGLVKTKDIFRPQSDAQKKYQILNSIFEEAYERLIPIYERLAAFNKGV